MPHSFRPFAEPYTPNLVPQTTLGGDVTKQFQDLERYLAEEFGRIQAAMLFVPVQAAYGAIVVSPGPAADQPLGDVPQKINGWNNQAPLNTNRIDADFTDDTLQVTEGGVYQITVEITAEIDQGREYTFTVAINGVQTDIFVRIDPSQQTDVVTIPLHVISELDAGDVVTLEGEAEAAGQPHTFIMDSAIFSIIRVSELHGRNAASVP